MSSISVSNTSTSVKLRDVWLSLGEKTSRVDILKGVNLDIEAGSSLGLLGASGSGKSTLLMVASGLEQADKGDVIIGTHNLSAMKENDLVRFRGQNIGIVFQSFHLIPTMTAHENVAMPLEISGDEAAFAKAEATLGMVGLSGRLDHYPAQLSGGEQQRVALARALAPRPALLVADEPTGNLDGQRGRDIADLMFDLVKERGTTLLLVTHDPKLAQRCDNTMMMGDGKLLMSDGVS